MTQQEYKTTAAAIGEQIKNLQAQISELRRKGQEVFKAYTDTVAFPNGSKVLVRIGERKYVAFVSGVEPNWRRDDFIYLFKKPKKDGTMSAVSAGIWAYDSVEKID